MPQRVEHHQVLAGQLHHGREPLVVLPDPAVPGLRLDVGAVVHHADAPRDGQGRGIAIDLAPRVEAHGLADPRSGAGLDRLGVVEDHDRAGGPLPEQLVHQDGAVGRRAPADIVAQVDQDDGPSGRGQGSGHGLRRLGRCGGQAAPECPESSGQPSASDSASPRSSSVTTTHDGPAAATSA